MGRQLRRVPLDFRWPLNKPWKGYINPHPYAPKCMTCDGDGMSERARHWQNLWYGYVPFDPTSTGSKPLTESHPIIIKLAERNCGNAPPKVVILGPPRTEDELAEEFAAKVQAEAIRLAGHFNTWMHHLAQKDVDVLVNAGRLTELTHDWRDGKWVLKDPPAHPTAAEVNEWSLVGFGHDSINQWLCTKARCTQERVSTICSTCDGEGHIWESKEAQELYESWEKYDPPTGAGYQVWETVSEGSPISPVFGTPEELAYHMAGTRWGADKGTSEAIWLAWIKDHGWALSMIGNGGQITNGVDGVVSIAEGAK